MLRHAHCSTTVVSFVYNTIAINVKFDYSLNQVGDYFFSFLWGGGILVSLNILYKNLYGNLTVIS